MASQIEPQLQTASDAELQAWLAPMANVRVLGYNVFQSAQAATAGQWIAQIQNGQRSGIAAMVQNLTTREDRTLTFLNSLREGLT